MGRGPRSGPCGTLAPGHITSIKRARHAQGDRCTLKRTAGDWTCSVQPSAFPRPDTPSNRYRHPPRPGHASVAARTPPSSSRRPRSAGCRSATLAAHTCSSGNGADAPSKLRLMLVSGKRESRSSSTTSVRRRRTGSWRRNCVMCPGYHDGGAGRAGNGMCCNIAVCGCPSMQSRLRSCGWRRYVALSGTTESTGSLYLCTGLWRVN